MLARLAGAGAAPEPFQSPRLIRAVETGNVPHTVRGLDLHGAPAIAFLEHSASDPTGFGLSLRWLETNGDAWSESTPLEGSITLRIFLLDAGVRDNAPVVCIGVLEDNLTTIRFLERKNEAWMELHREAVEADAHLESHLSMTMVNGKILALVPDDTTSYHLKAFVESDSGWTSAPVTEAGVRGRLDLISGTVIGGSPAFAVSSSAGIALGTKSSDAWSFEEVFSGWGKVAAWSGRAAIVSMFPRSAPTAVEFLFQNGPAGEWSREPLAEDTVVRSVDLAVVGEMPIAAYWEKDPESNGLQLTIAQRVDDSWNKQSFSKYGGNWLNDIDVFEVRGRPYVAVIDEQHIPGNQLYLIRPSPLAGSFRRGDANGDERIDISDTIWTINFLARGGVAPPCLEGADANDDGRLDLGDAVYVMNYTLLGGPRPAAPSPECGGDPTPDELGCAAPTCEA
jgi:hypothetical protein